jgi:hypothetical protein
MVLKEGEPIIDVYVYDPIEGQNEGFMPLDFEIDKRIMIPLVVPIPLIMGSLGISFFYFGIIFDIWIIYLHIGLQ